MMHPRIIKIAYHVI